MKGSDYVIFSNQGCTIDVDVEKTREYAKRYNNDKNSKIKIFVSADAPHTCNPDTINLCVNLAKELNTGLHIHLAETLDEETKIVNVNLIFTIIK